VQIFQSLACKCSKRQITYMINLRPRARFQDPLVQSPDGGNLAEQSSFQFLNPGETGGVGGRDGSQAKAGPHYDSLSRGRVLARRSMAQVLFLHLRPSSAPSPRSHQPGALHNPQRSTSRIMRFLLVDGDSHEQGMKFPNQKSEIP